MVNVGLTAEISALATYYRLLWNGVIRVHAQKLDSN